jgi:alpha-L-fucosidase
MKLRFRWVSASVLLISLFLPSPLTIAQTSQPSTGNRPDRIEWFRDLGFGMFIHWSVDSQIGPSISHSMVGADQEFLRKYVEELPKTFNPRKFYPQDWASLAKLAGMKYVVFTTKHHAGFCMFDTATTDYSIMHTPFHRDVTAEIVKAVREQGLAMGFYYSPDDFWWLYKNGKALQRHDPSVIPANNPGLMAHDQAQIRELLGHYGPIDMMFFDGEPEGLKDLAWKLQPNTVVTRGEIQTPELTIPGVPLEGPWEANFTMGTSWEYKPTNENYKSGTELISMLVETRAKGGNLLLNVGPKPDGELAIEQEQRLREMALWMMVNSECIYGVRPWIVTNENDYWFTKLKDQDTLYVIVKEKTPWEYGAWKDIVLHSVRATDQTQVSVLSENGTVLEYRPQVNPKPSFQQQEDGLHVHAMFTLRLSDNRRWPNPVVVKLTHVKPALTPPKIDTVAARWDASSSSATASGRLMSLGDAEQVQVGFEFRDITGLDVSERTGSWTTAPMTPQRTPGEFSAKIVGISTGHTYEIRAVVKHPLLTLYGREVRLAVP